MTEPESPPNRPVDSLFGLLDDPYRRAAIATLAERSTPVGLHALAGRIVESMRSLPAGHAPVDAEAIAIALHHEHLPRLADGGLVEYDVERQTVRVSNDETRVDACLDLVAFAVADRFDRGVTSST